MTLYVGIDPGVNGGIAVINENRDILDMRKNPDTKRELWTYCKQFNYVDPISNESLVRVCIEHVTGYIPSRDKYRKQYAEQGGNIQPGSRAFTFGRSYGWLEMALIACGLEEDVDFIYVTPQKWQKYLGIPKRTSETSDSQWKNVLKTTAQRMYPDTKITLKTADALLLAEYCLQVEEHRG